MEADLAVTIDSRRIWLQLQITTPTLVTQGKAGEGKQGKPHDMI